MVLMQVDGVDQPYGFKAGGEYVKLSSDSLLSKIRKKHRALATKLKLAVCITMYNEDEQELKDTIEGVLENFNSL